MSLPNIPYTEILPSTKLNTESADTEEETNAEEHPDVVKVANEQGEPKESEKNIDKSEISIKIAGQSDISIRNVGLLSNQNLPEGNVCEEEWKSHKNGDSSTRVTFIVTECGHHEIEKTHSSCQGLKKEHYVYTINKFMTSLQLPEDCADEDVCGGPSCQPFHDQCWP